jgi:hypothetical protein
MVNATIERSVIGFIGFIDRVHLTIAQFDDNSVVTEVANIDGERNDDYMDHVSNRVSTY